MSLKRYVEVSFEQKYFENIHQRKDLANIIITQKLRGYVYIYVHVHMHAYMCACARAHTHMYVCVHIYIYQEIYLYTNIYIGKCS